MTFCHALLSNIPFPVYGSLVVKGWDRGYEMRWAAELVKYISSFLLPNPYKSRITVMMNSAIVRIRQSDWNRHDREY